MAMTSAEKVRRYRENNPVPPGKCISCRKRKARAGKSKCKICADAAKAAVYRARGVDVD
jgi:hypothetical protein